MKLRILIFTVCGPRELVVRLEVHLDPLAQHNLQADRRLERAGEYLVNWYNLPRPTVASRAQKVD